MSNTTIIDSEEVSRYKVIKWRWINDDGQLFCITSKDSFKMKIDSQNNVI